MTQAPGTPSPVTRDVLMTLDEARGRLLARLDGLSDAEYLWQPVPDCLTVRPSGDDGRFRADPRPGRDVSPAPFSTVAWRIWHIGADCLRGYDRFFEGGVVDSAVDDSRWDWPGTAAEGVALMTEDWARFRARVAAVGDARLVEPIGPIAGPYGTESYLALALHALDEVAHHGAEVAVLRDLYLHGMR
ncbi:DinB family protein [Streptacidiphilus sp. NEAU-YB345]|uniref:DinB family protein n=2 Tax=Streptacidiphilus fuscans TaxID=2789292 RepID=A0A931FEK9_9ACTN|nr:DinB family protein [Streptacidiphilus fuscans]